MLEFKSDTGQAKNDTFLQAYSTIALVCAAYFSYSLILNIFTTQGILLHILWFFELLNEILFLYWAKQGIFWAKSASTLVYGRLFRVSIGLVTCQALIVLIELAALRSEFRWQCAVSLLLRIFFYVLTKRCFYGPQSSQLLNEHFDIPFFSYERLTETEQEMTPRNFRQAAPKELTIFAGSQTSIDPAISKTPEGEKIGGSFVFS